MHIARLKLWNFRKFGSEDDFDLEKPSLDLPLIKGTNVLVGENDSGKTSIVDAIRFVVGTYSIDWNRIARDDFYNSAERLRIEVLFEDLTEDEGKNFQTRKERRSKIRSTSSFTRFTPKMQMV